jgi:putative phosphoribosyl transferase
MGGREVPFINRADAGRRLARELRSLRRENPVVLGLPRGGVPVAFEVAKALRAPLDVLVVRKLGVPFQPELAMGAIGEGGVRVINDEVTRSGRISDADIAAVEARERAELQQRIRRLRTGTPRIPLADRTVIIVDDGIATGSTARAACRVARAQHARKVVLATPVGAAEAAKRLRRDADGVVCLEIPALFFAIGQWYEDFTQASDEQVADLLRRAAAWPIMVSAPQQGAAAGGPYVCDDDVAIPAGSIELAGRLTVPAKALGIVVFVHGSGSSRFSPRNRDVALALAEGGFGTLLFDLLTPAEELDRAHVFDIPLLATRLAAVTAWLRGQVAAQGVPIGYFGASTGAAAALWAAAAPEADIAAVVSRGGRPDLAAARLASVRTPTLLIVGGEDAEVLDLNKQAQDQLRCANRLHVVPGATHLFEEPGALAAVAKVGREWFTGQMAKSDQAGGAA